LWGPGEQEAAERLVALGGRGVYLSPALRLDELGSFLRQLAVVITIDSGLKHLAVAVGVPTVTLFGPTDPDEWHMGGRHDRVLFAALPCSPCRLLECPLDSSVSPCMKELTPDAVMREILTIEKGIGVR
jgi:ADP-heptose:LPS heptosyltransferase